MRKSTKQRSRKQRSRKRLSRKGLHNHIRAIKPQDEDYIDNVTTANNNGNFCPSGTSLHSAAQIGSYRIFRGLIKLGADIHNRHPTTQETVLDSAMKSFNYDIARYLKESGVEKSDCTNGETALHFAVEEGTKEVMTLLLTNNADINAKSDDGITPISNAVKAMNYHTMDALIKYVLDLFCTYKRDRDTKTIFCAAADIENYIVLKNWLISFSNRLDVINNNHSDNNFFFFFKSQMFLHYTLSLCGCNEHNITTAFQVNVDVNALESIKMHIVELIAAGFYVSDRSISIVSNTKRFDDYSAECLLEVEKMKKNVIEDTNITFIEILHKNVRYLAHYLKIVDLNKILTREPQFPEYPIYENKIFFKLWKAQIRVNYIKESEEVIYNIFYELQLPYTFIRELYFYLSNDDLKEVVQPSR